MALATCRALPNGDEDAERLCSALALHGFQAEWRCPTVDWQRYQWSSSAPPGTIQRTATGSWHGQAAYRSLRAPDHLASLHEAGTAMVQPCLDEVDTAGETALIYIDAGFSPAVSKSAMLADAITRRFGQLLYARVDLLPTPNGPVVIEVELAEPSLFVSHSQSGTDRFATATGRR